MKPPPFDYYPAATLKDAVMLLRAHGPEAKVLAGGQSLIPMMKLRLARPRVLIDLNRVREASYVRESDGVLTFGALARLADLESPDVRARAPILAEAARHIGHPAIRNRGTVCGSLAHADPAAELPVLALALEAECLAFGPGGHRVIPARDFFVGCFATVLRPDEILAEARFPMLPPTAGWSFLELSRRPGDFALAVVAAVLEADPDGTIARARIALGAVADRPLRCSEAEAMLVGERADQALFTRAGRAAAAPLDPPSDVHGSGPYRRHLAEVLVRRALAAAWERAARGRAG